MLETIIKLLERFVVAHELIAANSAKSKSVGALTVDVSTTGVDAVNEALEKAKKELTVEGEDVIDTKPAKAKPEPEDDLDDEEPEEKPKRKPRQAKPKDEPKGPDVAKLREEIKTIAKAIAAGDSDECADKFDELLEDYKVRTVTKLDDEDVEAFHKDATKLVGKYYEVEED
jgi:outer membrane biosynthesis protein TonB